MKVLDLFCKAGGASMGLRRHWPDAEIIGVDITPQPRYPFKFVRADVFSLTWNFAQFDFIWASPPCQAYSSATAEWRSKGRDYPDLVEATRALISAIPHVIENVVGAPLKNPALLCGAMFPELKVYRHRLFEASFNITAPPHPIHKIKQAKVGRPPKDGEFCNPVGHFPNLAYHGAAMGIDWMNKSELAEAIPPAYSEYIARQYDKKFNLTRCEAAN